MCLIIDITRKISGLNMSTRAVLTQISLKMVNFSSFWRFFSFSDPYSTSTMAVIMVNRVFFCSKMHQHKKTGRNLALYIDNKKILTEMSKKMTIFWRFFYIFTTLGPLNCSRGLETEIRCFHYLYWDMLVQNGMSHAMFNPMNNLFTAFENIVWNLTARYAFSRYFRDYFAIFIHDKCSDMVFQIRLIILHLLICDKHMFWAIAGELGRLEYGWWRHYLWGAISPTCYHISDVYPP